MGREEAMGVKPRITDIRKVNSIAVIILMVLCAVITVLPLEIQYAEAYPNTPSQDNFEAYFISKAAGNLSWGPNKRLSFTPTNTTGTTIAYNPDYDPDYIVSVYKDNISGDFDWYFSKSYDGGISWTPRTLAVDVDY
ncbi:MAG: hypothetical protein JSV56_08025, partial [Methanomassiliicoccales archaeon]